MDSKAFSRPELDDDESSVSTASSGSAAGSVSDEEYEEEVDAYTNPNLIFFYFLETETLFSNS